MQYLPITLPFFMVDDWTHFKISMVIVMARDKRLMDQVTFIICKTTMGNVASRLCTSSTPTLALSDICQKTRCLVACCGSEVHIDLRDATDEYQKQTCEEREKKEERKPEEPTFRETVL